MKVVYGIGQLKSEFKNSVLVIGVFDGVHLGHQELIRRAIQRAKDINGSTVVMTFSPHPVQVLKPELDFSFMVSLEHRIALLKDLGVDCCVVTEFTKSFSQTSPEEFIKDYVVDPIAPKEIWVGEDFRFGQNRSVSLSVFKDLGENFGFSVGALEPVKTSDVRTDKISSSVIRELILDGKIQEASQFLGRSVSVLGVVTEGDHRGRTMGYPTANLEPKNIVLPPKGVYAVKIRYDSKSFNGMANVGVRPTFNNDSKETNIETHIFDFEDSLYGKEIEVVFIEKIRNEQVFSHIEKLTNQLNEDQIKAKAILIK